MAVRPVKSLRHPTGGERNLATLVPFEKGLSTTDHSSAKCEWANWQGSHHVSGTDLDSLRDHGEGRAGLPRVGIQPAEFVKMPVPESTQPDEQTRARLSANRAPQ